MITIIKVIFINVYFKTFTTIIMTIITISLDLSKKIFIIITTTTTTTTITIIIAIKTFFEK